MELILLFVAMIMIAESDDKPIEPPKQLVSDEKTILVAPQAKQHEKIVSKHGWVLSDLSKKDKK